MKLTFEGETIRDIFYQMEITLKTSMYEAPKVPPIVDAPKPVPDYIFEVPAPVDKPVTKPVAKPVAKPVDKPVEISGAEKARKMREAKAAKAAAAAAAAVVEEPPVEEPAKPLPDVNEIVRIRQRTIVDLQEAYANGHQKEVFELLSRFGNGAKSFRELTSDAFLPIREAIDAGALK